jgi:D-sedoheptulose 7-phosphate isomerase
MTQLFFNQYFQSINQSVLSLDSEILAQVADMVMRVTINSRKIILVGNGGSAAMASHVAVDFTKTAKVRAVNFNEADLITCFANDYGYDQWVLEALSAYADSGDMVILISSSGKSPNIINAARKAKEMGLSVVTLSGFEASNSLRQLGHVNLWVDSFSYNIVEMTHHIWLLAIVDYLVGTNKGMKIK